MKFYFYGKLLSRLPNVELSHELALKNFKPKETAFYTRLFNKSDEGPFEVPPCRTKVSVMRKSVPGAPKLYVLHDGNSTGVFCSFLSALFFVGERLQ